MTPIKEKFAETPSLSCVENYFLAWLGEREDVAEQEFSPYLTSYREARGIPADFLADGEKYESYTKIERVMTLCERLGATSHTANEALNHNEIENAVSDGRLVLTRANAEFFKRHANKPWREDHYIRIAEVKDGGYLFLNSYPRECGRLTYGELESIYGGKTLIYERHSGNTNPVAAARLAQKQLRELTRAENAPYVLPSNLCASLTTYASRLRDAVGVIKVSRVRIAEWLGGFPAETGKIRAFMNGYTAELNKFYVVLEAAILRRNFNPAAAQDMIDIITEREATLAKLTKEIIHYVV